MLDCPGESNCLLDSSRRVTWVGSQGALQRSSFTALLLCNEFLEPLNAEHQHWQPFTVRSVSVFSNWGAKQQQQISKSLAPHRVGIG